MPFVRRLVETGAIWLFGMAVLMAIGAWIAGSMNLVIQPSGGTRFGAAGVSVKSGEAAWFWVIVAIGMVGVGIGLLRHATSKSNRANGHESSGIEGKTSPLTSSGRKMKIKHSRFYTTFEG